MKERGFDKRFDGGKTLTKKKPLTKKKKGGK